VISFPKYIKLGGHKIKIVRVPNLIKDHDAFGTWDEPTLSIGIDSTLSTSLAWETLIHECIESINSHAELNLEHHKIQTLGLLLHQALCSMLERGQKE
tara:strand:- start:24313 stop:24606 length:294 start_codon:yes stop_codon:yes gene_type:complete